MERPIPNKYLPLIISLMNSFPNETKDFNRIYIRPTLRPYIGPIILVYTIIFLLSQLFTFLMIKQILIYQRQRSLYGRTPFDPLLAICFNDFIIKGILVLPFSLIILVTVNWTHGSFLCFTFPMLQDSCFHVTSITYVIIFSNRYKTISKLILSENFSTLTKYEYVIPSLWIFGAAWTISALGSLPYNFFIVHIPVSLYLPGSQFAKTAVCSTNPTGNAKEYIRILFLTYYVTPIAMILSYHSKITTCMKNWQEMFNFTGDVSLTTLFTSNLKHVNGSVNGERCGRGNSIEQSLVEQSISDISINIPPSSTVILPYFFLEQSFHRILLVMFSVHGLTLLPINILRIWKHVVVENNENGSLFDILFITFVAIKYASVPISSSLFYYWQSRNKILIEICLRSQKVCSNKHQQIKSHSSSGKSYHNFEMESSSL